MSNHKIGMSKAIRCRIGMRLMCYRDFRYGFMGHLERLQDNLKILYVGVTVPVTFCQWENSQHLMLVWNEIQDQMEKDYW